MSSFPGSISWVTGNGTQRCTTGPTGHSSAKARGMLHSQQEHMDTACSLNMTITELSPISANTRSDHVDLAALTERCTPIPEQWAHISLHISTLASLIALPVGQPDWEWGCSQRCWSNLPFERCIKTTQSHSAIYYQKDSEALECPERGSDAARALEHRAVGRGWETCCVHLGRGRLRGDLMAPHSFWQEVGVRAEPCLAVLPLALQPLPFCCSHFKQISFAPL